LSDISGQLEIVDREVAGGVGGGDQAGGFRGGPGMAPEVRDAIGARKDAPHTAAGCIVRAGPRGEIGYDFADVCRP
jgi:hypothetical protein